MDQKEKNETMSEETLEKLKENAKPAEDVSKEEKKKEEPAKKEEKSKKESEAEKLKKENEELQAKIQKLEENEAILKNQYAKAYADTENMKRRLNNEFESHMKYHIQGFATEILPVLDNCERALAVKPKDGEDENYRKAFEMVFKQLSAALKKEGIEEIECLDKEYDSATMQAIMSEKVEGKEPNTVTEVLQKGYRLKDRLLRAAMVKVSE